jgi:hypothetical protein
MELSLRIASWDEEVVRELADGQKVSRASVRLEGDDLTGGFESVLHYAADGSSEFSSVMYLEGVLEGRRGGFVLIGDGSYDGTTARSLSRVVEGSGTGELAGIAGSATSASTHADYPVMPLTLDYRLP